MQRRDFIKNTCAGCAGLIGAGALLSVLNSCSPLPTLQSSQKEIISVPASSFIEGKDLLIVKNSNLEFNILLVKKKDNTYNALYMQCTHQTQPLSASKTGLFCPSHGSAFDLDGNVTVEPATRALKKFKTEIQDQNINIYLNS